jgi:hypothetical protein
MPKSVSADDPLLQCVDPASFFSRDEDGSENAIPNDLVASHVL